MNSKIVAKKTLLATFVGLFAAAGGASSAMAQGDEAATAQGRIDEIIVTANKREQSLQDTAMSVSALDSEDIENRGLLNMEDYLNTIPGVSLTVSELGRNEIVIRGIGISRGEEAAVSVYFGEVPLTNVGFGFVTEPKLVDIERVEVLRGPQGTLYGASSMGGTIRYVPVVPNLQELEGKLEAGYYNTADTGGDSNKLVGTINVPLIEDKLAARVVAYRYDNGGYIEKVGANDPATVGIATTFGAVVENEGDVANSEYVGARASLLWKPSSNLDVTLMYTTQELEQNGNNLLDLTTSKYQSTAIQVGPANDGDEFFADDFDIFNLVVEYDLGWASLFSSSSWHDGIDTRTIDATKFFLSLPTLQFTEDDKEGFVQEIRLNSQWDGPLQVLSGIYYEDLERNRAVRATWVGDPALCCGLSFLGTNPNFLTQHQNFSLEQFAVFGEVSYQVLEPLKLTLGGRWFDYERGERLYNSSGVLARADHNREANESDTSFKVNATYTPNDDVLLYAQWAEGFRTGKPVVPAPAATCDLDNNGILDGTNAPVNADTLDSDTLDSYELGGKFTLLDNRLIINSAIYHIEWEGIPTSVRGTCGLSVFINAGEARSQGMELESTYLLTPRLQVNIGTSYINAEFTEDDITLGVTEGTRLPRSSRFSASVGLHYNFEIAGYESYLQSDYAYVGDFRNNVSTAYEEAGDYNTLDIRAGIAFDRIKLALYGTNLTNSDELTSVLTPGLGYRLRPRALGLDISYQF